MRVIFHNPHSENWFYNPIASIIARVKATNKYQYFFDYFYNNEKKVYVHLDTLNAVYPFPKIIKKIMPPSFEFWLWVHVNKLDPKRFVIIKDINEIQKEDVFFTFLYGNFTFRYPRETKPINLLIKKFNKIKGIKVAHLTHYSYNIQQGANNSKNAKIDYFLSERNLKDVDYFSKFFNWYDKDVFVLPFIPKQRFKKKKEFNSRKNIALAMGTITHPITDDDFIKFFNNNKLQPMRNTIYENRNVEQIDSKISKIVGSDNIDNEKRRNYLRAFLKRTIEGYLIIKEIFRSNSNQNIKNDNSYMKMDIVSTFNEYKMCIVPEEIIGVPGISFIESMACGCAFIGIRDKMYSDIGLVDGQNYIAYDGTYEDLILKIKYYQNNQNELEKIAENGYKFINEQIKPYVIIDKFLKFFSNYKKTST